MRRVALFGLVWLAAAPGWASAADPAAAVHTEYDRLGDRTTVWFDLKPLGGRTGRFVATFLGASFSYPGQATAVAETIDVEILALSDAPGRSDEVAVRFVADGESVMFGATRPTTSPHLARSELVGQRLVLAVPYKAFVRLANARIAEVRLDDASLALGPATVGAARALLARTLP